MTPTNKTPVQYHGQRINWALINQQASHVIHNTFYNHHYAWGARQQARAPFNLRIPPWQPTSKSSIPPTSS